MARKSLQHLKLAPSKNEEARFLHENFIAGSAPNLRGPYSTMYVKNHGQYGSMQVFLLQKKAMLFIVGIWKQVKKDFL